MLKVPILSSAILCLFLSLPCVAQDLVPVIRLSPDEAAKAKQLAQTLKDAKERSTKTKVAWEQFRQSYQTAHPDLLALKFTDDFRFAVARLDSSIPGVFRLATIELTAEERQKLDTLHREMTESEDSRNRAENNWKDFKIQLVVKHIGTSTTGSGGHARLSTGGEDILLPNPWAGELAFTTDFRLATPLF